VKREREREKGQLSMIQKEAKNMIAQLAIAVPYFQVANDSVLRQKIKLIEGCRGLMSMTLIQVTLLIPPRRPCPEELEWTVVGRRDRTRQ
jgi:hypothetical protein